MKILDKIWWYLTVRYPDKILGWYRTQIYTLKWFNSWDRIKFQLWLISIGGCYSGYWTRPQEWRFPIQVRLYDAWNWLFVKKTPITPNEFNPNNFIVDVNGKKHKYYYDYQGEKSNPFRQRIWKASYFTTSKGWEKLIQNLVKELVKAGWNKEICDIKSKYASLRFYTNGMTQEQSAILKKYEKLAACTCEWCGKPGKLIPFDWYEVTCRGCIKEKELYDDTKNYIAKKYEEWEQEKTKTDGEV